MSNRLTGKVALITGAARGQGSAEARRFVAEGARVLITDVLDADILSLILELVPTPAQAARVSGECVCGARVSRVRRTADSCRVQSV